MGLVCKMGEASAADLVRMRNEYAMDPSLMENSSAMDRSNVPMDQYVTIGSVGATGQTQSVRILVCASLQCAANACRHAFARYLIHEFHVTLPGEHL